METVDQIEKKLDEVFSIIIRKDMDVKEARRLTAALYDRLLLFRKSNMNKKTIDAAKYSGISGALGGSFTIIFAWLLTFGNVDMPTEVTTALTVIFSFVINIALAKSGIISSTE
jgi:hypothetical protein